MGIYRARVLFRTLHGSRAPTLHSLDPTPETKIRHYLYSRFLAGTLRRLYNITLEEITCLMY